jgi:hypothetical protein
MKIIHAYDHFGPKGPIPNSTNMRVEEFFHHFYGSPISGNGWKFYAEPDFDKFLGISRIRAHHSEIRENTDMYSSMGPIVYMINFNHNLRYQGEFVVGSNLWTTKIPKNIIDLWKQKKCSIIISHIWDDPNLNIFKNILESFKTAFGSLDNMYIWTTAIFKESDAYAPYRKHVVHIPYAEMWSINKLLEYQPPVNVTKNKKFIKLVRRYTPGRVLSHISFTQADLNRDGFISMPSHCVASGIPLEEYMAQKFKNEDITNVQSYILDAEPIKDIERSKTSNFLGMNIKQENLLPYFHQSYFSVVAESRIEHNLENFYFYTEKLIRPMLYNHPFILLSTPGALEYLRAAGYKTFENVWPEDYDKIQDYTERTKRITELVKSLCSRNLEQLTVECAEIVTHNRLMVFQKVNDFRNHIDNLVR